VSANRTEYPRGVCGTARKAPTGSLLGDPLRVTDGTPDSEDGASLKGGAVDRPRRLLGAMYLVLGWAVAIIWSASIGLGFALTARWMGFSEFGQGFAAAYGIVRAPAWGMRAIDFLDRARIR